jgi:hypothetical protein
MGHTLTFARRINLAAAVPRTDLASSRYCLTQLGQEYLVYLPRTENGVLGLLDAAETVRVDLSASHAEYEVEWFDPGSGETFLGGRITGGEVRTFTAPFRGDAVLYLKAA